MNKTPLFARKQSGGIFTVVNESVTTGNIFWVDSGNTRGGDTVGHGSSPDQPFLTVDFAISQCTASQDIILFKKLAENSTIGCCVELPPYTIKFCSILTPPESIEITILFPPKFPSVESSIRHNVCAFVPWSS